MTTLKKIMTLTAAAMLSSVRVDAAEPFVSFTGGDITIARVNEDVRIAVADDDNVAVKIAARNLATDLRAVSGARVEVSGSDQGARIVAGTLQSPFISRLVKEKKINGDELRGKTEKYIITTVDDKLVIAGSDRRGAVYGIYELSRQAGVSPWYYWADVPIARHDTLYALNGVYTDGEPAVRYRGIFLNDEAPCLTTWVKNTFGTQRGQHDFYAKVFELLLRLKGNYMWPAMWGWAFYADDPLNSKTADDMGVMIGTSHHEPMSRSQKEWNNHSDNPNVEAQDRQSRVQAGGKWDYSTNKDNLDRFWQGGVERNKDTEDIITIGMRGDGDMAMSDDVNVKLLEEVVKNQRSIISKARGKDAKDVPQLWALYKEVMDYYDAGMKVPDDVIMLLCDDNWGNVRRVPTAKERKHKGGWGLYYHVDYVGAPRNSKTINVTPTQNMWEQLTLAYDYGIDKLWILNVGDLKPMEYPIQLFMDMAWNAKEYTATTLQQHTLQFCNSVFGQQQGAEAARLLNLVSKMNGRCTPEMLDAKTYNIDTDEWAEVVSQYKDLELAALRQYTSLAADQRDAYFQLILFPAQLMSALHEMYYSQAMNNKLHDAGDAAMNHWAERTEAAFQRDQDLMSYYNTVLAGGKWNGMMLQKHIGYTSWNDAFTRDTCPEVFRTSDAAENIFTETDGYVAMEAEHYAGKTDATAAQWTAIPDMGRTLSALTLMPQTADVTGATLTYKFNSSKSGTARVTVVTKSTLDFLNKGGMTYSLSLDGSKPVEVNFNGDLNEAEENIYSVYYPTVASRVVSKTVDMPLSPDDQLHTLTFQPNDPGIVLEKIVVDMGGYQSQYLFGKESPRR